MKDKSFIEEFIRNNFQEGNVSIATVLVNKSQVQFLKELLGESGLTLIALLTEMDETSSSKIAALGESPEDWEKVKILFEKNDIKEVMALLEDNGLAVAASPGAKAVLDMMDDDDDEGHGGTLH